MKILTTAEAAAEFHVTVELVERWRERGLLQPVAPGRYNELDVAHVEARTRRAPRRRHLAELAAAESAR